MGPPHRKTETKMFLFKLIVVTFVALASAQEEQSPSSYANYLTGGFQQPLYQGQQQSHPVADKRQGFNINNIDGVTAAALSGGANAVYTTVGLLSVNSRTTNNCNKVNKSANHSKNLTCLGMGSFNICLCNFRSMRCSTLATWLHRH